MASCSSSLTRLPPNLTLRCHRNPFRPRHFSLPIRGRRWILSPLLASHPDPMAETASSWAPIVRFPSNNDGYGGWSVPRLENLKGNGGPKLVIPTAGFCLSVAAIIAAASCLFFSRKGYRFYFFQPLPHISELFWATKYKQSTGDPNIDEAKVGHEVLKVISKETYIPENMSVSLERSPKIITVAADSTQLHALDILKKLNIIENDVQPYDICTRREYARWLIRTNFLLERSAKYRVAPSMLIAGSTITAFDDVSIEDPDFLYVQAIGEAGIVSSKLSDYWGESGQSVGQEYKFIPDSFLSRIDLLSWKFQLEYPIKVVTEEKMLKDNVGFADVGAIPPNALPELLVDALAGSCSIARQVFGNTKRLQPLKPVTKAQAAVAISSGRMTEAIQVEVSRREAENMTRLINKKEIELELVQKGEIRRYWEERMSEERWLCSKMEQELSEVSNNLEKEKIVHKKEMEHHVKEKASLECQKRLLKSLKVEVNGMLQKLANEKATVAAEQQTVKELLVEFQEKQNAIIDTKSILEAEKEALQILRTWAEEEARKNQFHAKVLEDAVQRWKWDDQNEPSESR